MTDKDRDITLEVLAVYLKILGSINDVGVKECIRNDSFIAGGAISSLYLKETPKDYDIFFRNQESLDKVKGHYLPFPNSKVQSTDNAITTKIDGIVIQFICKVVGTPDKIISGFDFVHCQGYFDYSKGELVLPPHVANASKNKELIWIEGGSYPIKAIYRMQKFILRGFKMKGCSIYSLAKAINALNLKDNDVVIEEILGLYIEEGFINDVERQI